MTIHPARHECHTCCLLRAGFLAFQPVVENTRGTRVEQVVSSFQKIFGARNSNGTSQEIENYPNLQSSENKSSRMIFVFVNGRVS